MASLTPVRSNLRRNRLFVVHHSNRCRSLQWDQSPLQHWSLNRPSSWDCGLFGKQHTRTRITESELSRRTPRHQKLHIKSAKRSGCEKYLWRFKRLCRWCSRKNTSGRVARLALGRRNSGKTNSLLSTTEGYTFGTENMITRSTEDKNANFANIAASAHQREVSPTNALFFNSFMWSNVIEFSC